MEQKEGKFSYTYSAPTEAERREIESIRNQYSATGKKPDTAIERLRNLNKKVKMFPTVFAYVLGVIGILIAGVGMTMVLEWNIFIWGCIVGAIGFAIAAVVYPIYRALYNRNKRKYGQEIIDLSNELLNVQDK